MYLVCAPANDDDLQTIMGVEMNVQTRVHQNASFMLHIRQHVTQVVRPMIIQKTDDADNFFVALADLFLDQVVTNQVANGLGTVLISLSAYAFVEGLEEVIFKRNAEAR